MANEKKSIIKDAITDYKEIQEAAEKAAKDKLSNEFPDKFKNLVKEELNNNKSAKESYNKIDESETKNTKPIMKKEETKKVVKEEREKEFTGDVENDTPNLGKGENEDGDAFTEKTKKTTEKSTKTKEEVNEEFDISDLEIEDVENTLDEANPEDEIVTMEEIEKEISEMEDLKGELDVEGEESVPFDKLASMRNQLQEMLDGINNLQEMHKGEFDLNKMHSGEYDEKLIDEEEEVDEQKTQRGKQNYKGRENGGPTGKMIDEDEMISDEDVDAIMDVDDELDEAQGGSLSSNKHVAGDHLPGKDYSDYKNDKKRYGSFNRQNEMLEKRVNALINENKKLIKKINESKKYKETVTNLVENYKNALDKYRTQLKEMAVYNTNLAHVNNLLINEELALTQEEKIKVIKEFKSVDSINESQKKYEEFLTEMKEGKKTISKGATDKITGSVLGESSKKQLDEVNEKTAYQNDKHINRMKSLIEYVEKKDNKKING